jgi:hypothetical protein
MSEYKFINIKKKYYDMVTYFLGINIRVKMTYRKCGVNKKYIYFSIPSPRIFLNTIYGFLTGEKSVGFILNIARKLFHINFLLKIPIQEGIFNIHIMYLPFM